MSTELDRQSISGNRTQYVDTELEIHSCSVFIDHAPSVIELDFTIELGKLEDRGDNVKLSSSSINVDWARSKLSSSTWFPYTYWARQCYRARYLTVCLSSENGKGWKSNNGQHLRWIKKVRITPYSPCVVRLFVFFSLAHTPNCKNVVIEKRKNRNKLAMWFTFAYFNSVSNNYFGIHSQ